MTPTIYNFITSDCYLLECFVLIWRIIHYLCVDKTVGDSDAVERRCMDHVLTSE